MWKQGAPKDHGYYWVYNAEMDLLYFCQKAKISGKFIFLHADGISEITLASNNDREYDPELWWYKIDEPELPV